MSPAAWAIAALFAASFAADNAWQLVYAMGGCTSDGPCVEARLAYTLPWLALAWLTLLVAPATRRAVYILQAAAITCLVIGLAEPRPLYQVAGALAHMAVLVAAVGLVWLPGCAATRRLAIVYIGAHALSLVEYCWARFAPLHYAEASSVLAQAYGPSANLVLPILIGLGLAWAIWPRHDGAPRGAKGA